jgi:hypothetical protein
MMSTTAAVGPLEETTTVLRIVALSPTANVALKLVGEIESAHAAPDASTRAPAETHRKHLLMLLLRLSIALLPFCCFMLFRPSADRSKWRHAYPVGLPCHKRSTQRARHLAGETRNPLKNKKKLRLLNPRGRALSGVL